MHRHSFILYIEEIPYSGIGDHPNAVIIIAKCSSCGCELNSSEIENRLNNGQYED